MKKVFLSIVLIAIIFVQAGFAQTSQKQSLLSSYYDIKNALVSSDAATAAAKAADFLKVMTSVDTKSLSPKEVTAFKTYQDKLNFDARHISESKDVAHQREHFASFSLNFSKLVKVVKLTDQPIYNDYCPMKKSYWLSSEKTIKNPYYGKQMETCGSIAETI